MKTGENMGIIMKTNFQGYLDYSLKELFTSRGYNPTKLHLFYDIACHYKKHVEKNPHLFDESVRSKISYAIGEFHVRAHGDSCLRDYNPKLMDDIGTTDGEAAERSWPWFRGLSVSVKGMHSYRRMVAIDSLAFHLWEICFKRFPAEWINKYMVTMNKLRSIRHVGGLEKVVPQNEKEGLLDTIPSHINDLSRQFHLLRYLLGRKDPRNDKSKTAMIESKAKTIKKLSEAIEKHNNKSEVLLTLDDVLKRHETILHSEIQHLREEKYLSEIAWLERDLKAYWKNFKKDLLTIKEMRLKPSLQEYEEQFKEQIRFFKNHQIRRLINHQSNFKTLLSEKKHHCPSFDDFLH
jgi:hypothetical protein